MAEHLFFSRIPHDSLWTAGSAGLSAVEGLAASQTAIEVMEEIGINLRAHQSRELTADLIDNAAIILVMTAAHAMELKKRFPKARDRVHMLGSFKKNGKDTEISDPVGAAVQIYRRTRNDIAECLDGLTGYLQSLYKNKH